MSTTLPIISSDPDQIHPEPEAVSHDDKKEGLYGLGLSDQRIEAARQDALRQADMPIRVALSKYKSAAMWAGLMTLTVVMEAYDYNLMGSLFGFPSFAQQFGKQLPNGKYNISAATQSIIKQSTKGGQLIGLLLTGTALDRFGYKWTMLGSLVMIIPMVFIQFFAKSVGMLVAGQVLIGIPLAPFLTLSSVYGAEISPVVLQTYFTSVVSLGWTIGNFVSTGILRGLLNSSIERSYRIAFAVQWIWLLPIGLIIYFAPESPSWCVRSGRTERARAALHRLSSEDETDEQIDNRLAVLEYTNALEKHYASSTSWFECFRGVNLRRTEISIMVYSASNLNGYDVAGATSYFFQQAGLSAVKSFDLGLGNNAISFVSCLICWVIISRYGRRPLFVFALGATSLLLLGIGGLGIPAPSTQTAWATGGLCYVFRVIFQICQDPLTYSFVVEVPSSRLRAKTAAIARGCFIFSAVFMVVLTNYQINATAWNWRGKAGFFWAPICFLMFVWAYFRLPETKNKSPAELDKLFMEKVPARKFASTHFDVVDESTTAEV